MEFAGDGIVVTGANGLLGRALLATLAHDGHRNVVALVRSDRARRTIEAEELDPAPDIRIVDYTSPNQMEEALRGARCVVHLVGIIKEMPGTRYVEAHERTCHALALAAGRAGICFVGMTELLVVLAEWDDICFPCK